MKGNSLLAHFSAILLSSILLGCYETSSATNNSTVTINNLINKYNEFKDDESEATYFNTNFVKSIGKGQFVLNTKFGQLKLIKNYTEHYDDTDNGLKDELYFNDLKLDVYDKHFEGYGIIPQYEIVFDDMIVFVLYNSDCESFSCGRQNYPSVRFLSVYNDKSYKLSKPYFIPMSESSIDIINQNIHVTYLDYATAYLGDLSDDYTGEYLYNPELNQILPVKNPKSIFSYLDRYKTKTAAQIILDNISENTGELPSDSCADMPLHNRTCFQFRALQSNDIYGDVYKDQYYKTLNQLCTNYGIEYGASGCEGHYIYFD